MSPMKASSRSVRVDDESYRLLVDYSRREDRPIRAVVRAAVAQYRTHDERAGASPPPATRPPGPTAAGMAAECPHPDDRRKPLSWGTICLACGNVVR